jgi:signal transduction histidine kinase
MANREKLKIAFLNIIINAVEAVEKFTGSLSITIDTNKWFMVTIRDNGCGIPEENISRLFEPYFTSKRNGMGLGLAATLNILQSHKASIDVMSVMKQGTTFTITFPAGSSKDQLSFFGFLVFIAFGDGFDHAADQSHFAAE